MIHNNIIIKTMQQCNVLVFNKLLLIIIIYLYSNIIINARMQPMNEQTPFL